MHQFFADVIDQLDLALDQLAIRDRNFDRFAMMLIDNVVELTLHQHARDRGSENEMWGKFSKPKHDPKLVAPALGQRFEPKVKLAKGTGLLPSDAADSVLYLHALRNTVYHQGQRHEGILHSCALFYLRQACLILNSFKPMWWMTSSTDRISHRALKYVGNARFLPDGSKAFGAAWTRLGEVAASMGDTLVADLHTDLASTIDRVDHQLDFLSKDSPRPLTRRDAVIYAQAWTFARTDEAKAYAAKHAGQNRSGPHYVDWLAKNYKWPVPNDPIKSWRKRLSALNSEKDPHAALKKYADFLRQTEEIRLQIDESAASLDEYIQHEIDVARGK